MKENFNFIAAFADMKKDFVKGNILNSCWKYMLIIIGSVLLAAGDGLFLIPHSIVSGGVSGVGIVLNAAFGWDVNLTITILTWVLFFVGFVFLGAKFSVKTLLSSILFPTFIYLFTFIYANVSWMALTGDPTTVLLLAAIFGGVLCGLGCGLTYIGGGSTGGMDNISLTIAQYWHIKAAVSGFIIDFLTVISYLFVKQNLTLILIGIISAFVCAMVIDKTYIGGGDTYVAQIISSNWEEINNRINKDLDRGTTLVDSYGGYTGEDKVMIQVAFSKDDYDVLQKIVFRADPKAFISITHAFEVKGNGFRKVSFRIDREIKYEQLMQERNKKSAAVHNIKFNPSSSSKPVSKSVDDKMADKKLDDNVTIK